MVPESRSGGHALLLARDDEIRQHRKHRAIHGHGHAHAVERNAVEQDFHVLDGIDRHARLADIAFDPGMIAVIAAMGGKIERHRQAHLPRLQILAVEEIGFLGGGKTGILADGPGPAGIHAGPHAARERRQSPASPRPRCLPDLLRCTAA